jgi:NCS1 family nucleobase:cation symporter-1
MLNISRKLSARTVMWIAGIMSILVALVFPMEQYENFLFFIGAMFIPLYGVILTDYFILRRRRLDIADIYRERGQYWYRKGFNPAAIIAWAAGFAVYEAMAVLTLPVGGSLPSMFTAGIIYWVFARAGKTAS